MHALSPSWHIMVNIPRTPRCKTYVLVPMLSGDYQRIFISTHGRERESRNAIRELKLPVAG